jgi:hypothetical protein
MVYADGNYGGQEVTFTQTTEVGALGRLGSLVGEGKHMNVIWRTSCPARNAIRPLHLLGRAPEIARPRCATSPNRWQTVEHDALDEPSPSGSSSGASMRRSRDSREGGRRPPEATAASLREDSDPPAARAAALRMSRGRLRMGRAPLRGVSDTRTSGSDPLRMGGAPLREVRDTRTTCRVPLGMRRAPLQ